MEILVFIFGSIIGSFLNALSFRYNSGKSIINSRSECMSCGHKLGFFDLIPILSFILLRRKCRYCRGKISYQYPLIEILSGLLFLFSYLESGFPVAIYWWFVFSLLIVIGLYDLKHKIIPDGLVYSLIVVSLLSLLLSFHLDFSLGNLLAGPIFALPFALLWLFSSGRLMGLGDVKLFLALGLILGLSKGLSALIISFWLGAGISVVLMSIFQLKKGSKQLTMKSEVPFGPFIILSIFILYFFPFALLNF